MKLTVSFRGKNHTRSVPTGNKIKTGKKDADKKDIMQEEWVDYSSLKFVIKNAEGREVGILEIQDVLPEDAAKYNELRKEYPLTIGE